MFKYQSKISFVSIQRAWIVAISLVLFPKLGMASVPANQLVEANHQWRNSVCRVNDSGTGVVVDKFIHNDWSITLCILTADHVVNAQRQHVTFGDVGNPNAPQFQITGYHKPHDENSGAGIWIGNRFHKPDIAVLKVHVPVNHPHHGFALYFAVGLNLVFLKDNNNNMFQPGVDIAMNQRPEIFQVGFGTTGNVRNNRALPNLAGRIVSIGYLQSVNSYGTMRYFHNKIFRVDELVQRQYSLNYQDDVTSTKQYSYFELVHQLDDANQNDHVMKEGTAFSGDSGSPVMIRSNGVDLVVGIHARGQFSDFDDLNGNGQWDAGEPFFKAAWRPHDAQTNSDGIGALGYAVYLVPEYIAWIRRVCARIFQESARGTFAYFSGNPANSWYTVGGTCAAPTLTANYLFFISGDLDSAGNPARWTSIPFRLHSPTTFDSIVYMPGLTVGSPELRIWITGSVLGGDGRPQPDLNNVIFSGSFGLYPGDPPALPDDEPIRTYYGGTTTFTYLRRTSLGQSVSLPPGLYFAIIVADEDFGSAGPLDSYTALGMGAPGGPKLYYNPRGLGSQNLSGVIAPASWQRFRYNNITGFPVGRILNPDLEFRAGDPFAGTAPWNTGLEWKDKHGPALYQPVFGLQWSQAAHGKVVGTAVVDGMVGTSPPTNVEVIFYRPGTKQRVARFSMPTVAGPYYPIDTMGVSADVYDVVVRPIYAPSTLTTNCPTDLNVVNVSYSPNRHWLGVRIPEVYVFGTIDLGDVVLPSGDTNGDMKVDDGDLLTVLFSFGSNDAAADVNDDGSVDDGDLLIVLFSFGLIGEDGDED